MQKSQFMCTFSYLNNYEDVIQDIFQFYQNPVDRVYVLQSQLNLSDIFLTYSLIPNNTGDFFGKTISMHRKKQSNTLYTINSLNAIVKKEIGYFDPKHVIDWMKYRNSIVSYNDKLNITPIVLIKIVSR